MPLSSVSPVPLSHLLLLCRDLAVSVNSYLLSVWGTICLTFSLPPCLPGSGFWCHALPSSLTLLFSVISVCFSQPLDPSCLCDFSFPELSLLPSLCLFRDFCLPFSFPFPAYLSPLCESPLCMNLSPLSGLQPLTGLFVSPRPLPTAPPTGLTTPPPPARSRLRCYTCSFAKPCYPVPTECQEDEACGISIGTSGRTLAQWPFSRPVSIHPSCFSCCPTALTSFLPGPQHSLILSHRAE